MNACLHVRCIGERSRGVLAGCLESPQNVLECPTCRDTGVIGYGAPADAEPCDNCPMGAVRHAERYVGGTVTFLPRAAAAWCSMRAAFARRWAGSQPYHARQRAAGRTEARNWLRAAEWFRSGAFGAWRVLP